MFPKLHIHFTAVVTAGLLLQACTGESSETPTQEGLLAGTQQFYSFVHAFDSVRSARDPLFPLLAGESDLRWSDVNDEGRQDEQGLLISWREKLRLQTDTTALDTQALEAYRVFRFRLDEMIQNFKWRKLKWPLFSGGVHEQLTRAFQNPAEFRREYHPDSAIRDIGKASSLVNAITEDVKRRKAEGFLPARGEIQSAAAICAQSASMFSAPDESMDASWSAALGAQAAHTGRIRETLSKQLAPAFASLGAELSAVATSADTMDGIGRMPEGKEWFTHLVASPESGMDAWPAALSNLSGTIRDLQRRMDGIAVESGFTGTRREFFDYIRADRSLWYGPDNPYAKWVTDAQTFADSASAHIQKWLKDVQPGPLRVRESASASGLMECIPADTSLLLLQSGNGGRIFRYALECEVFRNVWPGKAALHHFMHLPDTVPSRNMGYRSEVFEDGWCTYASLLPARYDTSVGLWSRFGYLLHELSIYCAAVADADIHLHGKSRQQVAEYLRNETPMSEAAIGALIAHIACHPGEASRAVSGLDMIRRWKETARTAAGSAFSEAEFHTQLLKYSYLPYPLFKTSPAFPPAPTDGK